MTGPCRQFREQIVDHVLGVRDPSAQADLLLHLGGCPACDGYRQTLENEKVQLSAWAQDCDGLMPGRVDRCLEALAQAPAAPASPPILPRRKIMLTPIIKFSAAAAAVAIVTFSVLFQSGPSHTLPTLLSTVCAMEDALFAGTDVVYIHNEITVLPSEAFRAVGFTWLPMCSLKANGQFRFDQLRLALEDTPYTVTDKAWYDPPTGRFVRVLETADEVVFANAYDGEFVYTPQTEADGRQTVVKQLVSADFRPPARPADFFGMAAGLRSGLSEESESTLEVTDETLTDGTPVRVFKVGTPDPEGRVSAYWRFKVREDDQTVAEKVFVVGGETHMIIRRVATTVQADDGILWDLSDIATRLTAASPDQRATVLPDMVVPNISIERMVEQAGFETYVFSQQPQWSDTCRITDVLDPASPGQRMFIFACPATDGRHIVLVQSPTYNALLGRVIAQGEVAYESPNGFKAIGGGRSHWMAGILLQSAQSEIHDPPAEDRVGYILQSPAGTYPALAVNGPISDEELRTLVDSLAPAKDYVETVGDQP